MSLQTVEAHPYATEIYQNDAHYLRQFDRFGYLTTSVRDVEDTWLKVIETGVAQGAFRGGLDPMVFYRLMPDAVWLSVRWFKPTQGYPINRLADECTSIFMDGMAVAGR